MNAKSQRWQKSALAVAAAAVLGLWGSHACALSLGRVAVLSALGEPLRAEIDILDINTEETASLKTSVASPDAFRSSGMEYNAALSSLQISLQKRTDGRSFLRLSSERAINDPFVDLILEASWSSGRIVRDYTMLFDPPNLRQAQVITPAAPQVSAVAASVAAPAQPALATATAGSAGAARPAPSARPAPAKPAADATAKPAAPASQRITVKTGATASKIAAANRPAGVSLDQMLVALLRANPDAFVGDNINRIRAGVVITIPDAEQALATPAREASQIVQAQSRDFSDYRSKLASNAPLSQMAAADRKASGSVQARVEDRKPAASAPDKLTLSKAAVEAKASEDKITQERGAKETAARAEELSKNIADLNKLSTTASAPTAPAAASIAAPPQAVASAPAAAASMPVAGASAPQTAASAPVTRPAAPAPAPMAEPGLLDELLDNPLVPPAAAGLVALLAGLGFYRIRQRRNAAQVDSSFLESRLQPDSFFGASGGQRVDTHDGPNTGSSMVYSPSQIDADEVDPIAEADVYLAYGRDMQAEEILKEALRLHPERLAIHQKLLEIYAKRQDPKSFESIANEAYKMTGGKGPDWDRVCELGMGVSPGNSLYQPGGQPASSGEAPADMAAGRAENLSHTEAPVQEPGRGPAAGTDLDLDLDFSLDEQAPAAPATPSEAGHAELPALDLNFDLPIEAPPAAASTGVAASSQEFEASAPTKPPTQTAGTQPSDAGMLEFDLGSLSLDLGTPSEQPAVAATDDPLATKLALAEEFNAIGDTDGARALIEEIIVEATGDMKTKAQEALSKLN